MMHGLQFHDEALGGLVLRLLIRHQVTSTYSLYNNSVLRVQPPMVIDEAELDHGLDVLEQILAEVEAHQAAGGATGVAAMSPQRLSVELAHPADAVRELLGRRPRLLDPFSLHPGQEDCPPVEPEFAGTLGEDLVVWEDRYEAGPDGPSLSAGDCWMWTSLRRDFTVVALGEAACRVDIAVEWDAGTGGYEALLAGGISWFIATRTEELAGEIDKYLAA
jgi:putrescine aminotransferase